MQDQTVHLLQHVTFDLMLLKRFENKKAQELTIHDAHADHHRRAVASEIRQAEELTIHDAHADHHRRAVADATGGDDVGTVLDDGRPSHQRNGGVRHKGGAACERARVQACMQLG